MFGATSLLELDGKEPATRQRRRELEGRTGRHCGFRRRRNSGRSSRRRRARAGDRFSRNFGDLLNLVAPAFMSTWSGCSTAGHLLPRAKVTLSLGGIVPTRFTTRILGAVERELTIDLFEPPQRGAHPPGRRSAGVKGPQAEGDCPTAQCEAGGGLPGAGLGSPEARTGSGQLVCLGDGAAVDLTKFRRTQNGKFQFKALEGYEPPPI